MKKLAGLLLVVSLMVVVGFTGCGVTGGDADPHQHDHPTPTPTPAPVNLLVNPGFEADLGNWVQVGPCAIIADVHSGSKAVKFGDGTGNQAYIQQDVSFTEAGAAMTLSGYGKITQPVAMGMMVQLEAHFLDASDQDIGTAATVQFNDWSAYQYKEVNFTTPVGVQKIRVKVLFNAMENNMYGYVDDLSLVRN